MLNSFNWRAERHIIMNSAYIKRHSTRECKYRCAYCATALARLSLGGEYVSESSRFPFGAESLQRVHF